MTTRCRAPRSAALTPLTLCVCLGVLSACGNSDSGSASNSSAAGAAPVAAAGSAGSSASGQAGAPGQAGTSSSGAGAGSNGSAGNPSSPSTAGSSGAPAAAAGAGGSGQTGGATQTAAAGNAGAAGTTGAAGAGATGAKFSFFVTSLEAIRRESKNQNGYGGNLGGLAGADAICTRIAEAALPGSGAKGWRAFLSTSTENAIERIGAGPWYDRNAQLVANDTAGLLQERPNGSTTVSDLPNELGVPNRAGTGTGMDDNHDTVTASNTQGKWDGGSTCNDWTSATGSGGPRVGHSWPAQSGKSWIQAHNAPGCEPSVALVQTGAGSGAGIGNGGGYGGFYCFALKP
ncbi:MAG TPA: hypothetical protein VFK05_00825 [Polyangiaceae bacterium]|nr:hypothetical protein [Polyangiaceae bacterium]